MSTVTTSTSPEQVAAIMAAVPNVISGAQSALPPGAGDVSGAVRDLQMAIGTMAMSIIKDAFITKSRGGTDSAGIQWAKLSAHYIAYGRRHPGLKRKKAGERPRGLLTQKQDDRWRKLCGGVYHRLVAKGVEGKAAAAQGAAFAWAVLKTEGAKTILKEYGDKDVEIGRDTGVMFNSASFGIDPQNAARVILKFNTKYAAAFHAKRPLWPADDAWPDVWLDQLTDILADGVVIVCRRLLGAA
jgi:hypothetical protein